MDYKYIEQLLERYWECQTSASEESILRSFFTQEEVPAHLAQYKSLFEYMEVAGGVEVLGEEFDALNIAPRKAHAWVRTEFEQVVQRLVIQFRMCLAQLIKHQKDALKQAVLADTPARQVVQSRGCCPMRGVHWYTSPCVLLMTSS